MIAGFVILIKGADFFVDGASGVAEKFHIPQIIIGLTIVAFGASAPEAAISISAALSGTTGIAIGNILGSNLLNILVILGISASIVPLHIGRSSIKFDIPFNILITVALVFFGVVLGKLNVFTGIAFWILMILFMVHLFRTAKSEMDRGEAQEEPKKKKNIFLLVLYIIGGLAAIILGSDLAVDNATIIASDILKIDDRLIGLTIIALGTSLPELMTSVMAARKGNADIAVGNILGSNIFNILFVVGTTALITPVAFAGDFVVDTLIAIAAAVLLWICVFRKQRLNRIGGIVMLVSYATYFAYLVLMR